MVVKKKIPRAGNIQASLISDLDDWQGATGPVDKDLRQVVVQKCYIAGRYTYALQHVAGDTFVYRGKSGSNAAFNKVLPVLHLTDSAAGHTQTFEYAGRLDHWFIGIKPNNLNDDWSTWSKQIARIRVPQYRKVACNTKMRPRLSGLNHAGAEYGIGCAKDQFARVEAAVSPDCKYFLLAYGDSDCNGYFALYYLHDINAALDNAPAPTRHVDINSVKCLGAFVLPRLSGKGGTVGSLQGFAIGKSIAAGGEDRLDLYISSQFATDTAGIDRKIIKIPWGETDPSQWELVDLSGAALDFPGYYTELEGIQLLAPNDLYLTVAYHDAKSRKTYMNKVYEVSWH